MSKNATLSEKQISTARKRWQFLGDVLRRKKCNVTGDAQSISVRRFGSFGLLKTTVVPQDNPDYVERHLWYNYTCPKFSQYNLDVRHLEESWSLDVLLGFNNTGNVCVWPSEEILAYYCLSHVDIFNGKTVCELGGGMTCLAGLAVAQCTPAKEVLLTDGNEQSVQNLDVILDSNLKQFGDTSVSSRVLLWNEYDKLGELEKKFDLVIAADCFFFKEYQDDLVNMLDRLLSPQGEIISFAPCRNNTFYEFKDKVSSKFDVEYLENYDGHIWSLHLEHKAKGIEEYDPDIHYPMLMKMKRPQQTSPE